MSNRFQRQYTGPIRAVILDWAGTTVDYGSRAPAGVFIEVFARHGVAITMTEARAPMGQHKRDHIRQITEMPAVAERWWNAHGRPPTEADVEAMFSDFVPRQLAIIGDYAGLIPGVIEAQELLRARGIGIGTSTGYNREMLDILLRAAAEQGFTPDSSIPASEVPAGRPAPWLCFRNAEALGVYPMESCIKIGDTIADIEAGLNAGMWTVGITRTGNELGLSPEEEAALTPAELRVRLEAASARMRAAGAHYTAESLPEAVALIDEIEERLGAGQRP